jgi:hypothetical protein
MNRQHVTRVTEAGSEGQAGEPASTGRLQDGRFPPGVSGNPAGRLPGTKNRATKALTRKAVELAFEGDTVALRLCLEGLLPPHRSRRVTLVI